MAPLRLCFLLCSGNVGQVGAPLLLASLLELCVDGLGLVRRLHFALLCLVGVSNGQTLLLVLSDHECCDREFFLFDCLLF